jgi:hypothetical protein
MQVGLGTLLRVAIGQVLPYILPLSVLERKIGKFLGSPVAALPIDAPEIGADVDSLEQYRIAVKMLETESEP